MVRNNVIVTILLYICCITDECHSGHVSLGSSAYCMDYAIVKMFILICICHGCWWVSITALYYRTLLQNTIQEKYIRKGCSGGGWVLVKGRV